MNKKKKLIEINDTEIVEIQAAFQTSGCYKLVHCVLFDYVANFGLNSQGSLASVVVVAS